MNFATLCEFVARMDHLGVSEKRPREGTTNTDIQSRIHKCYNKVSETTTYNFNDALNP